MGLLVRQGLLGAKAGFGGFGSRLLISQGFLGAKAPLQSVFAKDTAFLSAKAQKLQNSACAEFWDGLPVLALEFGGLCPNSA